LNTNSYLVMRCSKNKKQTKREKCDEKIKIKKKSLAHYLEFIKLDVRLNYYKKNQEKKKKSKNTHGNKKEVNNYLFFSFRFVILYLRFVDVCLSRRFSIKKGLLLIFL